MLTCLYGYVLCFHENITEGMVSCSGVCQGVIALNMEDGTLHRFNAKSTILATGVFLPDNFQ